MFLGNQGVYDFTKNAFVFAAGAMIPIGSAYSAGTLTLRSGSVIVAEELLSEGAGFLVSNAGEAMDLNPTATMLLSIAASMGTSAGLTKLDQAYNVSGSFPKIDVTTPNPASMINDVGGPPASSGIDVPGAKVDDAVEGIGKVEGANDAIKCGKASKWVDDGGNIIWPPNNGAVAGSEEMINFDTGTTFGRIGADTGSFVAPPKTSPDKLSLAPGTDISEYTEYVVVKHIPGVEKSTVAPWFDKPGGGTQFKLPMTIRDLIREGYIAPK